MAVAVQEKTTTARQRLIDGLNRDLVGEYRTIIMYIQYAALADDPDRPHLQTLVAAQVADDRAHAQFLTETIVALGDIPATDLLVVPPPGTGREILETILDAERQAIVDYMDRLVDADAYGGAALQAELETQIQEEIRHTGNLERLLSA